MFDAQLIKQYLYAYLYHVRQQQCVDSGMNAHADWQVS